MSGDAGMDALLGEFVLDTTERMRQVEDLLLGMDPHDNAGYQAAIARLEAELHTLKGNSGMMGMTELQALAHQMEDVLSDTKGTDVDVSSVLRLLDDFRIAFRKATGRADEPALSERDGTSGREAAGDIGQAGVRVPFSALDSLVTLLAETLILRNRLSVTVDNGLNLDIAAADFAAQSADAWNELQLAHHALGRTLDFLQESVLALRLVPLETLLGSLRRIVHDESAKEGKPVTLKTAGGDTPLDKALLELAGEVLGHLVRNAVIHGIEDATRRAAAGKPAQGTIEVVATARTEEVRIDVRDDGAGIDWDALRESAKAAGIEPDADANDEDLLFRAGVSAKSSADLSAGRGVGLSAVLNAVRREGGEIQVTSEKGRGTAFHLRLPLSVSITRTLLVNVDEEIYALPLTAVVESRKLLPGDGHEVNNAGVIHWRDAVLPLLDLGNHFGTSDAIRDEGYAIIINAAGKHRGITVDQILGIQEIVVRPLDATVGSPVGIGGSTVLGDGRPILILDPKGLAECEPFVREAA